MIDIKNSTIEELHYRQAELKRFAKEYCTNDSICTMCESEVSLIHKELALREENKGQYEEVE